MPSAEHVNALGEYRLERNGSQYRKSTSHDGALGRGCQIVFKQGEYEWI